MRMLRRGFGNSLLFAIVVQINLLAITATVIAETRTASLEAQILNIMNKESTSKNLKIGIAAITCSPNENDEMLPDTQKRTGENGVRDRFTAGLIRDIERTGNGKT